MKIILDSTLKSLEVKLGGAVTTNQLPWVVSYVDILTSDQSVSTYSENDGATNNTTAVTMVSAPASGHTRTIIGFSVVNEDTVAAETIIQYNNNGTTRTIIDVTLAVGDNLSGE